jgi:hypothetical protein
MQPAIQDFINGKKVALVGASRDPKKFGFTAMRELRERGYQIFPINPNANEIDGQPCYPTLAALPEKVDGVLVMTPPAQVAAVLEDAAKLGLKNVWVQQMAESADTAGLGQKLGLNLVTGKCILMYAPPVRSFHGFHGFVMKLIGQY